MVYKNTNLEKVTDLMATFQALASNLAWLCTSLPMILSIMLLSGFCSESGWQTSYFTGKCVRLDYATRISCHVNSIES